jgi:hypothetical protein
MDVEFEHGSHDPQPDVTGDDPILTGKIALAHMALPQRSGRLSEWFGTAASTCENQRELSVQRVKTSSMDITASPEETG